MKHARTATLAVLLILLIAPAVTAQGFPPPGPLSMQSKLERPLYINGNFAETVTFDSALTVNMGKAYQNSDGIRQVDFVATSWNAVGFSKVLGRKVTIGLTPNAPQPVSNATSLTTGADFPAVLTFRARYDAVMDGLAPLRGLAGLASGTVGSIPPGGNDLIDVRKRFGFSDGVARYEFNFGACGHPF
jgi:hypothetical protein